MTHLLKEWKNGNYYVEIYSDGTKIRYTTEKEEIQLEPEYPESLDVKITNYCELTCKYCHEQSSDKGEHCDPNTLISRLEGIPSAEIAIGGGNALRHPKLEELLFELQKRNFITSMTVNERSLIGPNLEVLNQCMNRGLIYGLGVSWSSGKNVIKYKNAVAHVIAGVHSFDEMSRALDTYGKILILGYKDFGRGKKYILNHKADVESKISEVSRKLWRLLLRKDGVVSFDNLAIEMLNVKAHLSKEKWEEFYMGDEGKFTMYYDAVKDAFAISSIHERVGADNYGNAIRFFQEIRDN